MNTACPQVESKVWVVDDDPSVQGLVSFLLCQEGFAIRGFDSLAPALHALGEDRPDLLVLDLGLPDGDGLDGGARFRERVSEDLPVLVITGSREVVDRYRTLAAGVDDYITKPLDATEFVLRVRNLLRRRTCRHPEPRIVKAGELCLDQRLQSVKIGERDASLTPSEYAILKYLFDQQGAPADVERILVEALGYPPGLGNPEIVRTHVRKIREKIEDDPHRPTRLVNRPRLGYMLVQGA